MSQTGITVLISGGGVLVSVLVSVFLGGSRWGQLTAEIRFMNDRLAKIEGLFTLTPRDTGRADPRR